MVTQTTDVITDPNNGDAVIDDGCETPAADAVLVRVNLFDIPAAPTVSAGSSEIYYCEDVDVQDISVAGEENAGDEFYWYATKAHAEAGTNRLTVADGKVITAAELIPDETDNDGNAVTNLDGSPSPGVYTFYVTQTTDIDNGASPSFEGSESEPLEITIEILRAPDAPVVNSFENQCFTNDNTNNPEFQFTGEGIVTYKWYASDQTTELSSSTASNKYQSVETASGDYTFYASQTNNVNIDGNGFEGCESPLSAVVEYTIYEIPAPPTVTGVGSTNDNEHVYCANIDLETMERTMTDAGRFYAKITRENGVEIGRE